MSIDEDLLVLFRFVIIFSILMGSCFRVVCIYVGFVRVEIICGFMVVFSGFCLVLVFRLFWVRGVFRVIRVSCLIV